MEPRTSNSERPVEGGVLLALDLGTTTVAGRLLDASGKVLAEDQEANPQKIVGRDVIRRLEASVSGEGNRLQGLLIEGVERLLSRLLASSGADRSRVIAAAAAGNSAISYLLQNLPPDEILFPPHRPRNKTGTFLDPAELGLDLPVPLYLFPLVSGYVGGDLVAFLNGLEPHSPGTVFLDIGTNGEMALFTDKGWWTTSVAAGPAFEGEGITCGMAAMPGAVEDVRVKGDSLELRTIGGGSPRGICGSGLLAAIAAGREGGLIDSRGTLADPEEVPTNLSRYIVRRPTGKAMALYRDAEVEILFTQEDIRTLQLAKGAVRAGIECLVQRAGAESDDIERVLVTGAFGLSMPPEILKRVAMIPPNMVDKLSFMADGVLAGICRFLQSAEGARGVQSLADDLRPYPLSGTPAFEKAFLHSLDF